MRTGRAAAVALGLALALGGGALAVLRDRPARASSPSRSPEAASAARAQRPGARAPRCAHIRCADADRRVARLLRPEQAPPLESPRVIAAPRARALGPTDRVLGLRIDGTSGARAYPLNLLAYHRVVADVLEGRPVVVAFSPLSESARCAVADRDERLRASGKVHEGDDLLVDRRTGSLWSVLLGSAVLGPRAGEPLARRGARCAIMTWAAWRALAPATTVAWPRRAVLGFDYRRDPWAWYRADDGHLVTPLRFVDLRLPRKQAVLGVALGGEARAFMVPRAEEREARAPIALNTRVGGAAVVVLLDGRRGLAAAYLRRVGGGTARFSWSRDGQLVDDRSGSRWNALGEAVSGPLAGERLEPAPGSPALFFAWAAHHPGTAIERRQP